MLNLLKRFPNQNMTKKKIFDFKSIEKKWREFWEKNKVYVLKPGKKIYSIDTPPPTVSGSMHLGHAFSYSQEDFIARFRRMFDGSVFYPFGTDDNGLPTEKLVENLNKVKSKNMSRAKFIQLCLKTLKKITPEFVQEWKDIGMSCDFNVLYSTIDDNTRKLSQKYFIDLYKKEEIYRKEFPTIWDVYFQTPVAQAELEDKEMESLFSTLKFSVDGKDLLIATTRPELLGACVAVFVHPKDKRYLKFIGKEASVPLFNYKVPIIADKSADPEKGTGVLMVCSYGDRFDVDAVNKYKLKPKIILGKDGKINQGRYKGLDVRAAREKILQDLKKKKLVTEQKKIKHIVNVYEKSGKEVEFLPTEQWFIRILDKREKLIEQGKNINWSPEFMRKRYENWIMGLEWDWSASRERHFGIPIPVWYCEKCGDVILPSEKELPVDPVETKKKCPKCKKEAVPDIRVLDTWVTSSLTPQIASNLTKGKIKLPFSLRPQGHDIIRTWAFYTITRALMHEKKIPWKDIVISGNVSVKGEKMSKSKGNVIEPKKVLDEFGADALRFWAAGSKLGADLDYQEKDLVTGRKFITKLLNASNFVFMNLKDFDGRKPKKLELVDELFLRELNRVIFTTTSQFEEYNYSRAKFNTEEFFWKDFTDNYLEIVKKRIYQGEGEKKKSVQYVLYQSLLTIIKMIAPIMPFITEEIYQTHFKGIEKDKSIHISKWPEYRKKDLEKWTEKGIGRFANRWFLLKEVISKIRQEKTRAKKSMNSEVKLTLPGSDIKVLTDLLEDLRDVTNATEIKQGKFKVEFK